MNEEQVQRVLAGDFQDLPSVSSRVIRIFTSSTFTDTTEERNLLIEEVYPKLKEYCRNKYGLEFQVVDMRWGVRDEATDDHSTADLCLKEIKNCQRISIGPNFVTFLGQRHGSKTFPSAIDEKEFEILLGNVNPSDDSSPEWIQQWFQLNENSIPPQYVLKPISTNFPDFLSEDQALKKSARDQWNTVHKKLHGALRRACLKCVEKGQISSQHLKKYFMSVTELEVDQGLFQSRVDPNDKCLCFVRIIDDIEKNIDHPKAWRYIDMTDSLVDHDAQHQLASLRDGKINETLANENVHRSTVNWCLPDGGVNKEVHKDYLSKFSSVFHKAVIKLIDKGAKAQETLARNELLMEVIQHAKMAENRIGLFHGRDDVIENVHHQIGANYRRAVVIFGHSGSGKTSVMAKCASLVPSWVDKKREPVVILRMLGTSAGSSDIAQTLQSVCQQIAVNFNLSDFKSPTDVNDTVRTFHALLSKATYDKPLFLFLDSLDQLSSKNGAHTLGWLPRMLPNHVQMVISTLPDLHDILPNLRSKLPNDAFIQIAPLALDLCQDIMDSWLKAAHWKLTSDQQVIVSKAFDCCRLPLYVKLVYEEVINWKSSDHVSETFLSHTVQNIINDFFKRLEIKHGATFVSHALAYITASKSGLSESEWEDVLSLDDTVLEDVFQYHIPPLRRIPQVLLIRVLTDISQYVVTREADNRRVIFWYHRQFIETARSRFLHDLKAHVIMHKHLADYFSGRWHNTKKAFEYNEYQMKKLGLSSPFGSADRLVPAQPLKFEGFKENGEPNYNLRMLNNLPWHLLRAADLMSLKKECLFNLDFLQAKLYASGIHSILNDLFEAQDATNDTGLSDLRSALSETRATLSKKPSSLPIELSGRLLHLIDFNPDIRRIVTQCFQSSALIPITVCYPAPGGALTQTLEHKDLPTVEMDKYLFATNQRKNLLALSAKNEIIVWDLQTGEVEREISLWNQKDEVKFNVMKRSANGKNLIVADAFQRNGNPVVIYNIKNEDITLAIKLDKLYKSVGFVDNFSIDSTSEYIIINIKDKEGDIFDMTGRLVHHFNQPASSMILTSTERSIIFLTNAYLKLTVFSLKTLSYWTETSLLKGTTQEELLAVATKSGRVFVAYKSLQMIDVLEINEDLEASKLERSIDLTSDIPSSSTISKVDLSSEEEYLLISAQMEVLMWDLRANKLYRRFCIPDEARSPYKVKEFKCRLDPCNNVLVMIHDERLIVFNVFYGRCTRHIHASKTPITELLEVTESMFLTANRTNRLISIWNVQRIEADVFSALSLPTSARYISAAGAGSHIVVRGFDPKDTRVLNTSNGQFVSTMQIDTMAPKITYDGKYVVLTEYNSEYEAIKVCEAQSGRIVSTIPVSTLSLKVSAIGMPPKDAIGSYLIATHSESSPTENIETHIWKLTTGSHLLKVKATSGGVSKMEFMSNNKFLVTLQQYPQLYHGTKCTIHVYNLDNDGNEVYKVGNFLKDVLFAIPNSTNILAIKTGEVSGEEAFDGDLHNTVIIDISNNHTVNTSNMNPTHLIHFSCDGKRAIDSTLRVFDIYLGSILHNFHTKYEDVKNTAKYRARITRDGKFAVWVKEQDGTLKVADIDSGNLVAEAFTHATPQSLEVSQDNVIAIGCDDGRIMLLQIWPHDKPEKEHLYESHVGLLPQHDGRMNIRRVLQSKSVCCTVI